MFNKLKSLLFVIILCVLWEYTGSHSIKVRLLISSPSRTLEYLKDNSSAIMISLGFTSLESVLGLLFALSASSLFGIMILYKPGLSKTIYPWLVISQVIPFICLAPFVVLVFGTGVKGKVFLSCLMAFFPILSNISEGVKKTPRNSIEFMDLLGSSKLEIIKHIYLPHCLPYFFAGMRVASPFCVVGAIVAEFNGAKHGIGKDLFIAAKRLEPELMMISLLSSSLLSVGLYLVFVRIEKMMGRWYHNGGDE